MLSAKALSKLLHSLYCAPTSPDLWPIFLLEFTQMLGLPGAAILSQDFTKAHYGFNPAVGVDTDGLDLYTAHYGAIDSWRPRFMRRAEGQLCIGEELCPVQELHRTEFYNDYLLKYDINLLCAISIVKRPMQIELLSLYTRWKQKPPTSETWDTIRLILPHVQSALRTRSKLVELETKSDSLSYALDLLNSAVVLLDEKGACMFFNRSAEQILQRGDALCVEGRRLSAVNPSESSLLHSLIDRTALASVGSDSRCGGAMLISRASQKSIRVVVAPFRSERYSESGRASAIVFISDPNQLADSRESVLRTLYGLTPAECRLAEQLAVGETLEEAGDANGVSRETVRSQLRSIFIKTGASRQSQLMKMLVTLPHVKTRSA